MAFVCRLMEQHGISYHFRHSEAQHEMVLGDDSGAWKKIEGGTRPYYPISEQHLRKEEHFFHWIPERRFTTGVFTLKDYYFETPGNKLEVTKTGDAGYEHGKLESYDYPGKHTKEDEGNFYVQARIDMEPRYDGLAHRLAARLVETATVRRQANDEMIGMPMPANKKPRNSCAVFLVAGLSQSLQHNVLILPTQKAQTTQNTYMLFSP